MKDTVAIVGSHPRTREAFDFSRTDCDIWLFNEAISNKNNAWAKRADAIFQMHVPAIWRNPGNRNDPKHYDWLQSQDECDVIMQDVYPDVPRSVRYPLESIMDMLGNPAAHFLSSSVPQAMALAALRGYKRVEVYGVAMETNTEYQFQREGVSFWIGFLKGRGIDVYFADHTFECPLYGYEGKVSVEYEQFTARVADLEPKRDEIARHYEATKADTRKAIELFEQDASAQAEQVLYETVSRQADLSAQLGMIEGAIQENRRYIGKADAMKDAAQGEFVFSRQEFESAAQHLQQQSSTCYTQFVSEATKLDIIQQNAKQAAKGSPKRQQLMQTYRAQLAAYLKANNAVYLYKGAANENIRYMQHLDKYVRAAGGSKSEAVLLESMRSNDALVAA